MMNLLPFIKLLKVQTKWILIGTLLAWSTILMGIGLMSVSGWFISYTGYLATTSYAMTIAFNYFYPSAGIRSFSLSRIISRYSERVLTHQATFKILTDIRVWFYNKLEPLAPAHLFKYKSGDLLTRLINDISALDNLYIRILSPTIVFLLATLSVTILFCFFDLTLALSTASALLTIGFIIPILSGFLGYKKSYRLNQSYNILKINITEHVNSLAELKIFDNEDTHKNKILKANKELLKQESKMSILTGFSSALMTLALGLTITMVTIFAVYLTTNNKLNGAFIALIFLALMAMFESIIPLPIAYQYLGKTLSAASRILNITNSKPDIVYTKQLEVINNYDIKFENVTFGYKLSHNIFEQFNLYIKNMEKIALFSPTGTGKSTLINLLARFYDTNKGSITIGNINIKNLSEDTLRESMTIISQSSHIFNTTIRQNLLLAKQDATDNELYIALENVLLMKHIKSLPKGLDTWTGELGKHLSGGQQKRLALARAFLQNKPILIFDEPTEGLDRETEKLVFENILNLMRNKTVIFITHNNKLLEKFDTVIRL